MILKKMTYQLKENMWGMTMKKMKKYYYCVLTDQWQYWYWTIIRHGNEGNSNDNNDIDNDNCMCV